MADCNPCEAKQGVLARKKRGGAVGPRGEACFFLDLFWFFFGSSQKRTSIHHPMKCQQIITDALKSVHSQSLNGDQFLEVSRSFLEHVSNLPEGSLEATSNSSRSRLEETHHFLEAVSKRARTTPGSSRRDAHLVEGMPSFSRPILFFLE